MGNTSSAQPALQSKIVICPYCSCDVDLKAKTRQQCPRCHGRIETRSNDESSDDSRGNNKRNRARGSFLDRWSSAKAPSAPSSLSVTSNASSRDKRNDNNVNSNNNEQKASLLNNDNDSLLNGEMKSQSFLEHVHIAPFGSTLTELEEKDINDQLLINSILKPYFHNEGKRQKLKAGNRLVIKNVEFKIYCCYPPQGIVVDTTQFHLNDNEGHLLKLHDRPIWRIHILPTKSSLRSFYRMNTNLTRPSWLDISDEKEDNTDPNLREHRSHSNLLDTHLREYLRGNDASKYIFTHSNNVMKSSSIRSPPPPKPHIPRPNANIGSCASHNNNNNNNSNNSSNSNKNSNSNNNSNGNKNNDNNNNNNNNNVSNNNENKSSNNSNNESGQRNNRIDKSERLKKRHLMEGELFVRNGIEFRVMACQPKDGFITHDTAVHVEGDAVVDIKSMTIRPLSETLPNRHKNLNMNEIKKIYLDPYFKGRSRYVDRTREVQIMGVDFAIIESVPRAGIITCETKITQKPPMNADDLRERQEEEDMALARRLQQEEDQRSGGPFLLFAPPRMARQQRGGNGGNGANGARDDESDQARIERHEITRRQIETLLTALRNANLQQVQARQRQQGQAQGAQGAQGQGADGSNGAANEAANEAANDDALLQMDPLAQIFRQLQQSHEARRGLPPSLLDRLPSYTFRESATSTSPSKENSDQSGKDKEEDSDASRTCRICLENYSEGDVIKILPCLHKYHEDCVDSWFKMSRKCPICNMDVTQAF